MLQHVCELLAEEAGDDSWRCLVGSQTVGIGGADDAGLEESIMLPYSHECLHDECDETQVVQLRLTWSVEKDACVGGETPVVMLAATVDAGKGLLMQQNAESVLTRYLLHE